MTIANYCPEISPLKSKKEKKLKMKDKFCAGLKTDILRCLGQPARLKVACNWAKETVGKEGKLFP